MKHFFIVVPLLFSLASVCGCANRVSFVSSDGEIWQGRWRYARGDDGLMQVIGTEGEILVGTFSRVARRTFVDGYEKTFGIGTIAVDGPDLSQHSGGLVGFFGASSAFNQTAYAEPLIGPPGSPGVAVSGPLFYWTANLQGDRRTTMQCFLIGSSYTGSGIGRCRGATGKEYLVQF
ncbi:MAG TPA: hypothetical protein VK632_10585 [Verrucomicrobiae bacterium]|nr:hypothetical protein [Verrucomicrobiae bacterium]